MYIQVICNTKVTKMKYMFSMCTDCKSNFNIFYLKQSVWSEKIFALTSSDGNGIALIILYYDIKRSFQKVDSLFF